MHRLSIAGAGPVEIADSPERAVLLQSRVPTSAAGLLEWLDPEELGRSEPALTTAQFGGLLCPVQGYIAVAPFIAALRRAAERHGAIFCRATVVNVVLNDLHCGLETIDKRQTFDRIVLSAGAWASFLDPGGEIRSAVKPIKGQLLDLSWRGPGIHRVLWGSSCYVVPWQDGTLLVGATSEDVGFDDRPTVDGVGGLLVAARALLPLLSSATFNGVRVGLRPATTGVPIVRPSSDPRVVYATGHFRNGVLLAPITARVVADYLLDGKRDPVFEAQNGA